MEKRKSNKTDEQQPLPKKSMKEMAAYIALQLKHMQSEENRAAARKVLGREPDDNDLAEYFVQSGQAQQFREKYGGYENADSKQED